MAEPEGPVGFWSYTRSDDENSDRELTRIRLRLKRQLQLLVGRPIVDILQDEEFIPRGTDWLEQIHQAIDRSLFFIPIVTPAFLHSEMCCKEVMLFRQREIELGRNDLIFPFHYIDTFYVQPVKSADCLDPEVLKLLRSRQGTKFHDLRNLDQGREDVGLRIGGLAKDIDSALRKSFPSRPSRATEPVTGPAAGPAALGARFVFNSPPPVSEPPATVASPASGAAPPPDPLVPVNPASSAPASLGGGATFGGVGFAGGGRVSGAAAHAASAAPTTVPASTGRAFSGGAMLGLFGLALLAVVGVWAAGGFNREPEAPAKVAALTPPASPATSPSKTDADPKPVTQPPASDPGSSSGGGSAGGTGAASSPGSVPTPSAQVTPAPPASPALTAPATQPAAGPTPASKPPDPSQTAKPEPAPFSSIWAKGCDTCPEFELVLIPAGTVNLGVSKAEIDKEKVPDWAKDWARSGGEPRAVPIREQFYLGRTHVTRAQFRAFMDNKSAPFPKAARDEVDKCLASFDEGLNKGISDKNQHPIVCVSYDDAMAYIKWLNKGSVTGPYRLPSEVEWEYAARGERVMKSPSPARYWGTDNACLYANVSDASLAGGLDAAKKDPASYFGCDDGYRGTSPVGIFRPNDFELKDMLGNAWQWVADCYLSSYDEPRIVNEKPRNTTEGCRRVVRGGSWYNSPWLVRAGFRNLDDAGYRLNFVGFRLARTLSLP